MQIGIEAAGAIRRRVVAAARRQARLKLRAWRRRRAVRRRPRQKGIVYVLAVTLIGLLASFGAAVSYLAPESSGRELSQNELAELVKQRRVATAVFQDEDAQIVGTYSATPLPKPSASASASARPSPARSQRTAGAAPSRRPSPPAASASATASVGPRASASASPVPSPTQSGALTSGRFYFPYPKSDALTGQLNALLVESGARVTTDKQGDKASVRLVVTFLVPLMILANLFTLLFSLSRSGSSGIGEITSFGTIGKGRNKRKNSAVTFNDVAGADEAVAELREVKDYLTDPERYEAIGASPPKGVLLFGPPGCGKTLLAKAVAGEAGVPFFSVAGAEFVESLVGVGAARVRDLFQRVRSVAPAIVFIDELDAAGRKRGTGGGGGGSDEREQTLNQMLVEMDGFEVSSGIVVMGATNRPDILDPALLRPGRFDRHVTVDQPDLHGRADILQVHARGKPIAPDVDLVYVARRTPGFTGADLANVINEAALLTVREGKTEIETPQLEEAIQRVISGPKRKGRVLSPEERKRAAYHESGHCVVAAASGRFEEVHRVSILARARSVGTAAITSEEEAAMLTESMIKAKLTTLMGGIAAEELVFEEASTGAEQDLEQATDLARDFVGRYGLSTKTGRVRLLGKASDSYLDGELNLAPMSGHTHQLFDDEMRRLLDEAETAALALLSRHRQVLDTLASRLEAEETLEGPDLEAILALVRPEVALFGSDGSEPPPPARNRRPMKVH